jgi:hypothetical protein
MDNGGTSAPLIIIVLLVYSAPLIAFIILYAVDFFYLAKKGIYPKEVKPWGEILFIAFVAIAGIPHALVNRRRAVKTYYEQGGKPLGGKYIFFSIAFGVVIGIWVLMLLCHICTRIYLAKTGAT